MYVYGLKYVCVNIIAFHPVVKRFINADSYASTGQGILGHNMFAYCQNNPVMYVDTSGNRHMMVDLGIVIIESEPELKTAGLSANKVSNSSKLVDDIENFDLFNTDEKK